MLLNKANFLDPEKAELCHLKVCIQSGWVQLAVFCRTKNLVGLCTGTTFIMWYRQPPEIGRFTIALLTTTTLKTDLLRYSCSGRKNSIHTTQLESYIYVTIYCSLLALYTVSEYSEYLGVHIQTAWLLQQIVALFLPD